MDFLLDTNILLWSRLSARKLSRRVRQHLENPYNTVYYSPLSMWEIAIKYGVGKLSLNGKTPEQFFDVIEKEDQFDYLELLPSSLVSSYQLPHRHHDPFDRMLVWEALQHDLVLLSADETLRDYEQDGLQLVA